MIERISPIALLLLTACGTTQEHDPTDTPTTTQTTWTGVLDEESFAKLHELKQEAAPELHGETVALGDSSAYLSLPAGDGLHPGIVVIHEWWGLNDHIRHWADRLAADGYAALAVDLYGGQVAETPEQARSLMMAVDADHAADVLARAHRLLAEDPRVRAPKRGVVGWCFGGGWSLKHAIATPDLDAAVLYYGRLETDPKVLAAIHAPLLAIFGTRDQGIPPAAVQAFEEAAKQADTPPSFSLRVLSYDAEHAFANPSSARYDAVSASAAWDEVRAFFASHLR
ncbi:MAG: dienelactone hydrolase family protein [Planctomycetes bacterium]|nr:dienelactone hydrolase family protein [Planctomycetota bacterium]